MVLPEILPETMATAPNSPSDRAVVRMTPYRMPQRMAGRVTRKNVRSGPAPQRVGRLLLVGADLPEHRHDFADHEREANEDRRKDHARHREDHRDAVVRQESADRAVGAVDQEQRQPDHDGRQGKRQVDQRIDDRAARKPSARDRKRGDDPKTVQTGTVISGDLDRQPERRLKRRARNASSTGSRPPSKARTNTIATGSTSNSPR